MSEEKFESMDRSLMKDIKGAKLSVPGSLLEGFSASVTQRIRECQLPKEAKAPALSPWLVPTFAVLIIASALTWRLPLTSNQMASGTVQAINLTANVASISDEVAALRELGVWTEEDDASAEI